MTTAPSYTRPKNVRAVVYEESSRMAWLVTRTLPSEPAPPGDYRRYPWDVQCAFSHVQVYAGKLEPDAFIEAAADYLEERAAALAAAILDPVIRSNPKFDRTLDDVERILGYAKLVRRMKGELLEAHAAMFEEREQQRKAEQRAKARARREAAKNDRR